MQQVLIEQLIAEWQALASQFSSEAALALKQSAEAHSAELAANFYEQMLGDPHSAAFLSHEQVKTRLSQSMQRWVVTVLSADTTSDLEEIIRLQKKVGEVHARIELPVSLVLRGARVLKRRLRELLEQHGLSESVRRDASRLGADTIDLAIEIMCFAFSQSHDRNSRAEEAYRLFSVSQNIGVEKERQRAALLDWENQLMFDLATGGSCAQLPLLTTSEFGLWYRHKASHAFQGSPESASILELIEQIDLSLRSLTAAAQAGENPSSLPMLRQIREQAGSIKFLLNSLFEQVRDLEAGQDVLTRLLNRKFLPVVLAKEVNYARQSGNTFGVLTVDIDHFKRINDTHGHDAGDMVLQQIAGLLASNTRSGDYTFRLGGEEFLVVLVDIDPDKAFKVAEKLRRSIAAEACKLPHGGELRVTVSIGMAIHDGHPDYERLLQQADKALYQAKNGGRNRSVLFSAA